MTPVQFEAAVASRFPRLAGEVAQDQGLLHVVMGDLYRYAQDQLAKRDWKELDRVFRLLEEAHRESRTDIENAIRVSFLEYFEFQGHEEEVRRLCGQTLNSLYEDQMKHMEDLARRAAEQRASADADDPRR